MTSSDGLGRSSQPRHDRQRVYSMTRWFSLGDREAVPTLPGSDGVDRNTGGAGERADGEKPSIGRHPCNRLVTGHAQTYATFNWWRDERAPVRSGARLSLEGKPDTGGHRPDPRVVRCDFGLVAEGDVALRRQHERELRVEVVRELGARIDGEIGEIPRRVLHVEGDRTRA